MKQDIFYWHKNAFYLLKNAFMMTCSTVVCDKASFPTKAAKNQDNKIKNS